MALLSANCVSAGAWARCVSQRACIGDHRREGRRGGEQRRWQLEKDERNGREGLRAGLYGYEHLQPGKLSLISRIRSVTGFLAGPTLSFGFLVIFLDSTKMIILLPNKSRNSVLIVCFPF